MVFGVCGFRLVGFRWLGLFELIVISCCMFVLLLLLRFDCIRGLLGWFVI